LFKFKPANKVNNPKEIPIENCPNISKLHLPYFHKKNDEHNTDNILTVPKTKVPILAPSSSSLFYLKRSVE